MKYIVEGVLLLLIFSYAVFVIRRRVKQMKAGQYCNCGCDSCPSTKDCNKTNN